MSWPSGGRLLSVRESPLSAVEATPMESGLVKRRLKYSRQSVIFRVSYDYSYDEYQAWQAWYIGSEAARGAGSFAWTDPASGAAVTATFADGGVPEWDYMVRVGEEVRYRLTISLAVWR